MRFCCPRNAIPFVQHFDTIALNATFYIHYMVKGPWSLGKECSRSQYTLASYRVTLAARIDIPRSSVISGSLIRANENAIVRAASIIHATIPSLMPNVGAVASTAIARRAAKRIFLPPGPRDEVLQNHPDLKLSYQPCSNRQRAPLQNHPSPRRP